MICLLTLQIIIIFIERKAHMLLREALQHLEQEDELGPYDDITFREKDAILLREECRSKYNAYLEIIAQVIFILLRNIN